MIKHFTIRVTGKVQGVFFRKHTIRFAEQNSITGIVRNEPDGSVLIEAEGDEQDLVKLVVWCHTGPKRAVVENVLVTEGEVEGFATFSWDA